MYAGAVDGSTQDKAKSVYTVPEDTKVEVSLVPNVNEACLELVGKVPVGMVIKSLIAYSEQLFDGDSSVVHPANPTETIKMKLLPEKNQSSEIEVKLLVGHSMNSQYYTIFKKNVQIVKFSMFR